MSLQLFLITNRMKLNLLFNHVKLAWLQLLSASNAVKDVFIEFQGGDMNEGDEKLCNPIYIVNNMYSIVFAESLSR